MTDRLLTADTRLTAEHIKELYRSVLISTDTTACLSKSAQIGLCVVFDMALREAAKAPYTDANTIAAVERGTGLEEEFRKQGNILAEVLERKACNDATLKARTEEMHKAHHKIERAKRVQRLYEDIAKENNDKLDLDEEGKGGWHGEDLDMIEMVAEMSGDVAANIAYALADLKPMTVEEALGLDQHTIIWWEDPVDRFRSKMIRVKSVEIHGDETLRVTGYGEEGYVECGIDELWKVVPSD